MAPVAADVQAAPSTWAVNPEPVVDDVVDDEVVEDESESFLQDDINKLPAAKTASIVKLRLFFIIMWLMFQQK